MANVSTTEINEILCNKLYSTGIRYNVDMSAHSSRVLVTLTARGLSLQFIIDQSTQNRLVRLNIDDGANSFRQAVVHTA